MNSDILSETGDYAFHEFCPVHMKDINAKINSSMSENTYYFSYAAGVKNINIKKKREMLLEPSKLSNKGMGFDLDVESNLQFTQKSSKTKRRSE